MSSPDSLGSTNERLTFRTYKSFVQKLKVIAEAHDLRVGRRLSLGAAINLIIGQYDASAEQAKIDSKKKGTKR